MSNRKTILLLLSASLILCTQSTGLSQEPQQTETVPAAEKTAPPEKVDVEFVVDDAAIRRRLQKILAASKWFHSPEVDVDEGIVILSGVASDDSQREWAGDVARRTEGVVAVINNIETSGSVDISQSLGVVVGSLDSLWKAFLEQLPLVCAGFLVLILAWVTARIVAKVVTTAVGRSHLRGGLQDLARQLAVVLVWITGIMVAAVIMFPGMTPAKLLTVLGLSSVAIGFAFKDIFENFFAGVLILWRFPLERGDFIECGGVFGKVEEITVRMTSIRQVDGQLVVLPNAMLFKQAVNVSTSRRSRRITVICGVAYGEDIGAARDVIRAAVEKCETVDGQHDVEIFAREFADSSINFEVTWWCGSTPLEERKSRDEVVEAVKRGLDDAGIEIPFPYRTLTFNQPLSIEQQHSDENEPAASAAT